MSPTTIPRLHEALIFFITIFKFCYVLSSGGSRTSQRRGANRQGGGAKLIFAQKFPKNCMKMKEFGPGGRVPGAPFRSANAQE